jgi:hypothetical protein
LIEFAQTGGVPFDGKGVFESFSTPKICDECKTKMKPDQSRCGHQVTYQIDSRRDREFLITKMTELEGYKHYKLVVNWQCLNPDPKNN